MRRALPLTIWLIFALIWPAIARANSNVLPTIMIGQTEMILTPAGGVSQSYYGGFTGNEIVFNYNPDVLLGFSNLPRSIMSGCINVYDLITPSYFWDDNVCHHLELNGVSDDSGTGLAIANLHSKTWVDEHVVMQTAALFDRPKMITGDTYGSLGDFAYWGRTLAHTPDGEDSNFATWKLRGYQLNSSAQSKWAGDAFNENLAKMKALASEATTVEWADLKKSSRWYLQGSTITDSTSADKERYPEGKVWLVNLLGGSVPAQLKLNTRYYYEGVGTIIVNGKIEFKQGTSLEPVSRAGKNEIGIITLKKSSDNSSGKCLMSGDNRVEAAFFCEDLFKVANNGKNIDLYGSYVAGSFDIPSNSQNVRFNYDFNLSRDWPPGFRYLSIPVPYER